MVIFQSYAIVIVCLFDGLYRHFEQYFNYIMAALEDPKKKPQHILFAQICKKDRTQDKQTYEVFSYIQYVTLFDRACMHMNISYINMCKLKKNRE